MTGALPWLVLGSFAGAAALYHVYGMGDADAATPTPTPDDNRRPTVITPGGPPRPGSKLPTDDPEAEIPPNLFFVSSLEAEAAVADAALSQGRGNEGMVLVIYRGLAQEIVGPELMIAATSFPNVTFLVYPEDISRQINATAIVHYTCSSADIVSVQGFSTKLTPQGTSWENVAVQCVSQANALELRAALATAADRVV